MIIQPMLSFVQAINIPRAFANKEQIQMILRNVGRINHISFHQSTRDNHFNAVIHLETSTAFEPCEITIFKDVSITLELIPDKFVNTMIGKDVETHMDTPSLNRVGLRIWDL